MLHDYALGTIFDHCDLRELARMSQVDRRSRNLAALTFQKGGRRKNADNK
ncbi:hypothetical protein MP631_02610 [Xanthomonas phaseoli pv. phaseoli]|nr:hypothetical protein MP631_02610 [Xanthomonas phaseoli pv. phaseoli]